MTECPKCGKDNGWAYSEGYLCSSCKRHGSQTIILVCSILAIFTILIGAVCGVIQYDYEVVKCSNLKSSESNYDFDKKIELDASYNQDCYFLKHHPFALFEYILAGAVAGIFIPILVGFAWSIKYV